MSLDSDILVDRRRLKRRLTFWRVLGILALVAVLGLAVSRGRGNGPPWFTGPHIARVTISGFIGESRERHDLLRKIGEDDNVKAVIVAVNSPGGSTAGGEELYGDLRELAKKKPVAAVFGTAATSAAYLAGIATDYIVARGNSITGSVGVIFQYPDVSDLLSKLGVKVEEFRSGPLKANPSPFEQTNDQAREMAQNIVMEAQGWFVGLVEKRRHGAAASLDEIKTGRIYTGRQALAIGLVDAIGGEATAITWFDQQRNVAPNLKVIDWKPENSSSLGWFQGAISHFAQELGLASPLDTAISRGIEALKARPLDGLMSIWQAQ